MCKIGELIKFKCDYIATESWTSLKVANDLLQNSSITLFNYNAKLKHEKYSSKIKDETLDFIIQKFNISPSLINELGAHKAINATVDKMVKDLELTPDLLVILERIADYISRGQDHYYLTELTARILEFVGRGLDNKALSYIQPLLAFWEESMCTIDDGVPDYNYKECIQPENTDAKVIGDSNKEEL